MKIEEYYDRFSELYDLNNETSKSLMGKDIDQFLELLPLYSTILDAGCGPGVESYYFYQRGHKVTGLDISDRMLERFQAKIPNAKVFKSDLCNLHFLNHSFDAVFCSYVLLHLDKNFGLEALHELRRVTKPLGLLFIGTACDSNNSEFYTHKSARQLGLNPIYFYYWEIEELKLTLKNLGYSILYQNNIEVYPDRPFCCNLICKIQLESLQEIESDTYELGTSWRSYPAKESEAKARDLQSFAGISRISRIEGLGGFKLPIVQCYRPQSKIAITTTSGKGTTLAESITSAIMEGVEYAASESFEGHITMTYEEISKAAIEVLSPITLCCSSYGKSPISWTRVEEYPNGKYVWVPTVAVGMLDVPGPFLPNSNGLASGFTFQEALIHSLLEVLERHAYSLALIRRDASSLNINLVNDTFCLELFEEIKNLGLHVEVKDISAPINIPCYYAVILDPNEHDARLINGGFGCHPDSIIALRRSLTECIQSRMTVIAGSREDIVEDAHEKLFQKDFKKLMKTFEYWYKPTDNKIKLQNSLLQEKTSLTQLIEHILKTARQADPVLRRLFYYVFPSPNGSWVIRSILEGAECFSVCPERKGIKLKQLITNTLKGGRHETKEVYKTITC